MTCSKKALLLWRIYLVVLMAVLAFVLGAAAAFIGWYVLIPAVALAAVSALAFLWWLPARIQGYCVQFENEKVEVQRGFLLQHKSTISFEDVQISEVRGGILERRLGIADAVLHLPGSRFVLRSLSHEDAQTIQKMWEEGVHH